MLEHRMDWNAKLLKFFFERSRLVWLIIIAILVGGIFSLLSLRREGFPQVSPKIVAVQTIYPGASAEEIELQITKPLEAAVKDSKNLKDISSTSQNSFSNIIINFEESANLDQTVQDVQSKVQSIKGDLPKDAEQPKINTFSTSGPSFFFGVTDGHDIEYIRSEAKVLANELSSVDGVKSAKLTQDPKNRVNIKFRPADLSANGVSLSALNQILSAASMDLPVGKIVSDREQSITVQGAFTQLADIENIIVGVNAKTFQPVYLKNIAIIEETKENLESLNRFGYLKNGKAISTPGAFVNIEVKNNSDIIQTRQRILDHIDKLRGDNVIAKDLEIIPLYDQGQWTNDQIKEIASGALGKQSNLYLLGGLQLLFIAMLLFVNWRSALVAALSIPFSLAMTFIALKMTGTQLNTMVLFSLILVLGLIVDPAIVMVEAIQRYLDLKYSPAKAVLESGRRYGASLFMAVLTSVLVFLPFGVVSGILGEIIRYIPLTIMPALIASYFIPIALLPYISQKLLKGAKTNSIQEGEETENLSKPAQYIMKANAWILSKWSRQVATLILAIVLVILSGSIVAMKKVKIVQFAKPNDNATLQISGTFAKGLPFTQKDKAAKEIEQAIISQNAMKDYFYLDQSRNGFMIYMDLKDKKERPSADEKSKEVVKRLSAELSKNTALADFTIHEISVGAPDADYQITVQLADNDMANLREAAQDVGAFLTKQSHVTKVDDGFTGKAESGIKVILNRSAVEKAGLSSLEVGLQVKGLLDESKVAKYDNSLTGEQEDIYLINADITKSIDELKDIPLASRAGTIVKLGSVATIKESQDVDTIERYNASRFVSVKARVDNADNVAEVQSKLNNYLTDDKLSELGIDSKLNKGELADMSKSFSELGIALAIAILLTYVVLVLQFGSFSLPGVMLFTVPLSFIGVFPALWLARSDFGFLELVGITILVGIVENVAIFLIDYANQLRKEKGLTAKEAIIKASGVRFRPILLTKLVALGGLLPLAIESEFWRGLSVVIIAGIGLSGFFSLITIPVLYVWISGLRSRIHKEV